MIVICEECGKKYHIDPNKIPGEKAKFRCKSCQHIIIVRKEVEAISEIGDTLKVSKKEEPEPKEVPKESTIEENKKDEKDEKIEKKILVGIQPKKRRFGLRAKVLILFFVIPLLIILGSGLFYIMQFGDLAKSITKEGVNVTTKLSEDIIANIARSVALQCKLYLESHPELDKKDFNSHITFSKIAVQKVGKTGYTALYELPDAQGVWRTWAHANPKIIGIDMYTLKDTLKENFPGFWKIYVGVKGGKESKGYYSWVDPDGKVREKFMVCTPIEGTNFIIAATTYIDEFTQPMKEVERASAEHVERVRNISIIALAVALLVFGTIVFLFGHRLTDKIRQLTAAADRISVGDLDFEIKIKSNDEIGDLAEAISRMQDSIKLSIERLRRRRG